MHLLSRIMALLVASLALATQPITEKGDLQLYTYKAPAVPIEYQNSTLSFSPTTFTLISTKDEAVLIDAPLSPDRGNDLADWIEATVPGRKLTAIYITHGHGDHFFAVPTLQQRFPGVKVLATQEVYDHMLEQIEPGYFASFWATLFPGLEAPVLSDVDIEILRPTRLSFYLGTGHGKHRKQHELRPVEVGEGDTYNSTVLYVPDLKAVVTGDVVYGHCFQYLAENTTPELRAQWIKSIDQVAALNPHYVIPSHARSTENYEPAHLAETKTYIRAFGELFAQTSSWEQLETSLQHRFPEREGSFILRYSTQVFFDAAF
ncbi:beta-lactamase-like protein [Aspergillus cavernicola]|uniref:Beta-lactamase-like protein n=1 Tax=Aspergillus cavernicola TaxID=176166 RepID=A0ABR4IHX0_9EURO